MPHSRLVTSEDFTQVTPRLFSPSLDTMASVSFLNYPTLLLAIEYVLDEMNFYQWHCRSPQWSSSLGLMEASPAARTSVGMDVPYRQHFERAAIFLLERFEMPLRAVMLFSPRTPPPERLKMLSLVGDGS